MIQNILFYFIDTHQQNLKLPDNVTLAKEDNYYRVDFPSRVNYSIGPYKLTSDHVSIYKTESLNNPVLSQYHYTAYFEYLDKRYQLHVYFDGKDERSIEPIFYIQTNPKNSKKPLFRKLRNDEFDTNLLSDFITLATETSAPIIRELRNQLPYKIASLKTSYEELEKQAAALENINIEKYEKALKKVSKKLKELIPLVHNNHYQNIHYIIIGLLKKIAEEKQTKNAEKSRRRKKATSSSTRVTETTASKNNYVTNNLHTLFKKDKKVNYASELKKLIDKFDQLTTLDQEKSTESLANIYSNTGCLLLQLEEESNSDLISLEVLSKLKSFHYNLHKMGKDLLINLLKNKEFNLAKKLPAFHHILDIKNVVQALQSRNHELLDFILENTNFIINNQPLTIKGKSYFSATHYCLNQSSDKSIVPCFSVLIKHGASLVVRDEEGPALLHTVLSSPAHPFHAALQANKAQTLESISFYKSLIADLNHYLKEAKLDEAQREKLSQKINFYTTSIHEILQNKELSSSAKMELQKSIEINQLNPLLSEYEHKLNNDKEYTSLVMQVNTELTAVLQKAKYRRNQQTDEIIKYCQNIRTLYSQLQPESEAIDYTTIRELGIESQKDSLEMLRIQNRLYDIQDDINSVDKKTRENARTEKATLSEALDILHAKYAHVTDEKKMQELSSALATQKKLQNILSLIEERYPQKSGKTSLANELRLFKARYENASPQEKRQISSSIFMWQNTLSYFKQKFPDLVTEQSEQELNSITNS